MRVRQPYVGEPVSDCFGPCPVHGYGAMRQGPVQTGGLNFDAFGRRNGPGVLIGEDGNIVGGSRWAPPAGGRGFGPAISLEQWANATAATQTTDELRAGIEALQIRLAAREAPPVIVGVPGAGGEYTPPSIAEMVVMLAKSRGSTEDEIVGAIQALDALRGPTPPSDD